LGSRARLVHLPAPVGKVTSLVFTAPLEFFFTKVKLAVFGAVVVTFPVLAWQLYRFVAPGLYRRERFAFLPFLIASAAFAQEPVTEAAAPSPAAPVEAAATSAAAPTAERIIVTGSYIPTAESESALPVTVYTAETIVKQGAQTPVEGLRQLPSFVGNTSTENDSNGGDGSALINLRAVGPNDTLTLINGRRAFLGDATEGGSDINLLGLGMLSRSEILKDGASSIYGSDAVAGVVNFILDKNFEGLKYRANAGLSTYGDGLSDQAGLAGTRLV